jgi:uncharacterized protein
VHYLLFYEKTPDHAAREKAQSAAHRQHLEVAVGRGTLLLGGSLDDPADGAAVLVFEADSPALVEEFAKTDPYVVDGLVNRWWVRRWDTVVGTLIQAPANRCSG